VNTILVSGDFPPMHSGVGDYCGHLANAIAANGCDVHVLTTAHPRAPEIEHSGNVVVSRCFRSWRFGEARHALSALRRNEEAVVNIQYYCPSTYGRRPMINLLPAILRFARKNARVVITMHGFWEQSRLFRLRCLPMLRAAHGVIFVDRKNEPLLRSFAGPFVPVQFVPISSNIPIVSFSEETRSFWRQELGIPRDAIVVAFFGGICALKGFDHLVRAIEQVRRVDRLEISLLAIGGFHADSVNATYQGEMKSLIGTPEIGRWVRVVEDPSPQVVSELLQTSDIGACPFVRGVGENSGTALASMKHGLPTITTSGLTRIPDTWNAVVIPASDMESLAGAIARLARSKQLRDEVAARCLASIADLDWAVIGARTTTFFSGLFRGI